MYSYTKVVSLYLYVPEVIVLVYTPIERLYAQFSLFVIYFADRGVELKRGKAFHLGGRILYNVQPFV